MEVNSLPTSNLECVLRECITPQCKYSFSLPLTWTITVQVSGEHSFYYSVGKLLPNASAVSTHHQPGLCTLWVYCSPTRVLRPKSMRTKAAWLALHIILWGLMSPCARPCLCRVASPLTNWDTSKGWAITSVSKLKWGNEAMGEWSHGWHITTRYKIFSFRFNFN